MILYSRVKDFPETRNTIACEKSVVLQFVFLLGRVYIGSGGTLSCPFLPIESVFHVSTRCRIADGSKNADAWFQDAWLMLEFGC